MKFIQFIFLVVISMVFHGCGEEKINTSIDSKSIERILSKMTLEEGERFLADADLVTKLRGSPYAINGYTVDQVRNEAAVGRRFVAEKNRELAEELIHKLIKNSKEVTLLQKRSTGIYALPEQGDKAKTYTLNNIKLIYKENGGDLPALEEKIKKELDESKLEKLNSTAYQSNETYCRNKLPIQEAEKRWALMSTDNQTYLVQCKTSEHEMAMRFGGMSDSEAKQHAKKICETLLTQTHGCMARKDANAADCICDIDE